MVTFFKNLTLERLVYILVPLLILIAIWLPPISLGERLVGSEYVSITPAEGGVVVGPLGASVEIPAGAVAQKARLRLQAFDPASLTGLDLGNPEFAAAPEESGYVAATQDGPEQAALSAIPGDVVAFGPIYRLDSKSVGFAAAGNLSVPIPYELPDVQMADLYGWDGAAWQWLPATPTEDGLTLHASVDSLPAIFMVAQAVAGTPRLSLSGTVAEIPTVSEDLAPAYVVVEGFHLDGDGGVTETELPESPRVTPRPCFRCPTSSTAWLAQTWPTMSSLTRRCAPPTWRASSLFFPIRWLASRSPTPG